MCIHHLELDVIDPECPYYHIGSSQRSNELNAEWFADISFIFPLIGVIFTWLAIRGIVKDITLLKSFDRIR